MSLKQLDATAREALRNGRGILFMADWQTHLSLLEGGDEGEVRALKIDCPEIPDLSGVVLEFPCQ